MPTIQRCAFKRRQSSVTIFVFHGEVLGEVTVWPGGQSAELPDDEGALLEFSDVAALGIEDIPQLEGATPTQVTRLESLWRQEEGQAHHALLDVDEIIRDIDREHEQSTRNREIVRALVLELQGNSLSVAVEPKSEDDVLEEGLRGAPVFFQDKKIGFISKVYDTELRLDISLEGSAQWETFFRSDAWVNLEVTAPNFLKYLYKIGVEMSSARVFSRALERLHYSCDVRAVRQTARENQGDQSLSSQQNACISLLYSNGLGFVDGAPGAGKTEVLKLLVREEYRRCAGAGKSAQIIMLTPTNKVLVSNLKRMARATEGLRSVCVGGYDRREFSEFKEFPEVVGATTDELEQMSGKSGESRRDLIAKFKQTAERDAAKAHLIGMTLHHFVKRVADNQIDFIRDDALIMVDEGSQVPLPFAMLAFIKGNRWVVAGDQHQLGPITKNRESAFAKSLFDMQALRARASAGGRVFPLTAQRRMVKDISEIISPIYGGAITVDDSAPGFHETRKPIKLVRSEGPKHVFLFRVDGNAEIEHGTGSSKRDSSAKLIYLLMHQLYFQREIDPSDPRKRNELLVISPYRAQRGLIQQQFLDWNSTPLRKDRRFRDNSLDLAKIKVSTVHSVQGSEAEIVVFDPVNMNSRFLGGKDGLRLLNVAFSRAKRALIVIVNQRDMEAEHAKALLGSLSSSTYGFADAASGLGNAEDASPQKMYHSKVQVSVGGRNLRAALLGFSKDGLRARVFVNPCEIFPDGEIQEKRLAEIAL